MDFTNRGAQPQPTNHNPLAGATPPVSAKKARTKNQNGLFRWVTALLGVVIIALVIAVIVAVGFSGPQSESDYVYSNKLQAVFLNTGQVYFGNIQTINQQYLVLNNIFYLQTNNNGSSSSSGSSNTNVSLVKLGCELHAPYDQMVINMNQVTFWENLQSNGQVAKAVAQYQKEYPHGQTCNNNSSTTSGNTSSSIQNAPTSTTKKP